MLRGRATGAGAGGTLSRAAASSLRCSSLLRSSSWRSSSGCRSSGRSTSASRTPSVARSAGQWVGFDNFTDRLARRELPTRAPQHAHLHARVAGDRRRRGSGALELPRPRLPRQVDRALSRGPALGRAGRPVDDHVALAVRLAVQRRQLDAREAPSRQRRRLGARRREPRGGRPGAAPVARAPEPRAARHHDRPRLANPPVRGRDLHRRESVDPDRGRGRLQDRRRDRAEEAVVRRRPAAAADRPRRRALRDRLHCRRLRGRVHPHARRPVQLDAGAADLGLRDRDRLRLSRRGRRDLALPLPAPRARQRRDAVLRTTSPGA